MYVIYLHTKFKMANLSGYVFTTVELKAKYRYLGGASILFFYILCPLPPPLPPPKNHSTFSVICYHSSFKDSTLNDACVAPISQVHSSAVLLANVGN